MIYTATKLTPTPSKLQMSLIYNPFCNLPCGLSIMQMQVSDKTIRSAVFPALNCTNNLKSHIKSGYTIDLVILPKPAMFFSFFFGALKWLIFQKGLLTMDQCVDPSGSRHCRRCALEVLFPILMTWRRWTLDEYDKTFEVSSLKIGTNSFGVRAGKLSTSPFLDFKRNLYSCNKITKT